MSNPDEEPQTAAVSDAPDPSPDAQDLDWLQHASLEEMMAVAARVQQQHAVAKVKKDQELGSGYCVKEELQLLQEKQDLRGLPRDLPFQFRIDGGFEMWHYSRDRATQRPAAPVSHSYEPWRGPKGSSKGRPTTALGSRTSASSSAKFRPRRPATALGQRSDSRSVAREQPVQRPKSLLKERVNNQAAFNRKKRQMKKGIIGGYSFNIATTKTNTPTRLHPSGQKTLDELRNIFRDAGMSTHSKHGKPIPHYALLGALPLAEEVIKADAADEHWRHWSIRPYIAPEILAFFKADKAALAKPMPFIKTIQTN